MNVLPCFTEKWNHNILPPTPMTRQLTMGNNMKRSKCKAMLCTRVSKTEQEMKVPIVYHWYFLWLITTKVNFSRHKQNRRYCIVFIQVLHHHLEFFVGSNKETSTLKKIKQQMQEQHKFLTSMTEGSKEWNYTIVNMRFNVSTCLLFFW